MFYLCRFEKNLLSNMISMNEERLVMVAPLSPFPQEYDPELFSKALPCLTAIACSLPPDYPLTEGHEEDWPQQNTASGPYVPEPVNTAGGVYSMCG